MSGERSLRGLQMATFSVCPHMAFPQCVQGEEDREKAVGERKEASAPVSFIIRTLIPL